MDTRCFYGRKITHQVTVNWEGSEDGGSDSDVEERPTVTPDASIREIDSDDSFSPDESDEDSAIISSTIKKGKTPGHMTRTPHDPRRKPIWKTIQGENISDSYVPIWKAALPDRDSISSPHTYFEYFFGAELLDRIVYESNLFAVQTNPTKTIQMTRDDLEKFWGCCSICLS